MMSVITGVIGIGILLLFLGVLVWWIQALPLVIIIVGVVGLLLYDFVRTVRYGESGPPR